MVVFLQVGGGLRVWRIPLAKLTYAESSPSPFAKGECGYSEFCKPCKGDLLTCTLLLTQ